MPLTKPAWKEVAAGDSHALALDSAGNRLLLLLLLLLSWHIYYYYYYDYYGGMRKGGIGQVNRSTQRANTNKLDFPIPPFLIPPFPISQGNIYSWGGEGGPTTGVGISRSYRKLLRLCSTFRIHKLPNTSRASSILSSMDDHSSLRLCNIIKLGRRGRPHHRRPAASLSLSPGPPVTTWILYHFVCSPLL